MSSDMQSRRANAALTVGRLITQLQALPPELPVVVEGCDCDGWAMRVERAEAYEAPYERGTVPAHVRICRQ